MAEDTSSSSAPSTADAVSSWFTANPTASAQDVATAVQSYGGLTPELASAIAGHYGTDAGTVQNAYTQLTAPSGGSSTTQGGNAVNDSGQTGGALSVGASAPFQGGQNAVDNQVVINGQTYPAGTYVNSYNGHIMQPTGLLGDNQQPDYLDLTGSEYNKTHQGSGGFFGGAIDALKGLPAGASALSSVVGPAAAILAPEIPLFSAAFNGLNAVNAAQNNNWTGALLSGLNAASAYNTAGTPTTQNPNPSVSPLDKSTVDAINTAKTGANFANAIATKNPLGLINSVMSATDTKLPSEIGTGAKLASAYISLQKGDYAGMMNSITGLAKSQDPKVSSAAQKVSDAVQTGIDPKVALDQFTKDVGLSSDVASAIASLDPTALAQSGYGTNVATLASADPNFTPVSSPLSETNSKKATDTNTDATETDTSVQDTGGFTGGGIDYYQKQLNNLTNTGIPEDIAKGIAKTLTNDAISKNQVNDYSWVDPTTGKLHISMHAYDQNTNTGDGGMTSDGSNTSGVSPLSGDQTGNANASSAVNPLGSSTNNTNAPSGATNPSGSNPNNTNVPSGVITDLGVIGKPDKLPPDDGDNIESINITGSPLGGDTFVPNLTKIIPDQTKVEDKPVDHNCAVGYHWDEASQSCVPDEKKPVDHNCGAGYHWDEASQSCVKDTITTVTPPTVTTPKVTIPQTTTPLGGSSTKDSFLPMVATMLAGAPMYNEKHKLAQLHQLYDSLDPHLAKVLQQAGIIPPEPPREENTQTDEEKILASAKQSQPENAQPFLFADGGSTVSDLIKSLEYRNIAPATAPMLNAAPVVQQESRLSPLRHLKQGIRKDAQPTSLLAQGGLPHKYQKALPEGHKPEFITGLTGYYADGRGTGQSDDIPAMLHEGDYVMDADTVASFGDGSSKAGAQVMDKLHHEVPHKMAVGGTPVPAKIADGEYVFPESFVTALGGGDNKLGSKLLDTMREELRAHKRSAPDTKIPPKAKSPLEYLKMAKG